MKHIWFVEIVICFMIYQTNAFNIGCPEPPERYNRGKALCKDSRNYTCLFDENKDSYIENCSVKSDFQRPGYRVTLRTNLHADACPDNLYQPFIFFANKTSNCEFQRSFCREEGQIVSNNGTIRTDRQCRCDYVHGYTYVTKPTNVCSCVPSVEDCSCYRKKCSKNDILSPDYQCIDNFSWHGKFLCSSLLDLRTPTIPSNELNTTVDQRDVVRREKTMVQISIIVTGMLLLIFLVTLILKEDNYAGSNNNLNKPKAMADHENETKSEVIEMALEKVASTHCLVLWGKPGCGKTTTLRSIANYVEKRLEYKLIHCHTPLEICKQHSIHATVKHAFVIYDSCGRFVFSDEKFLEWKKQEKDIKKLLQDDKVLLLTTCSSMSDSAKQFSLFAKNAFELTKDDVLQSDKYMYAEEIESRIEGLRLSKTSAFYCLFMLILKQGCIRESDLISDDNYIKISSNMCSKLGIAISLRQCLDALNFLLDKNFIVKENGSFSIKHYSIFEVAAVYFGKKLQKCFIKCADLEIITEHFCITSCNSHDRNGLFCVQVNKENEESYFQRITEQLLLKHFSEVFSVKKMEIPEYRKGLGNYLKQHKKDVKHISYDSKCRIEGVALSTFISHNVSLMTVFHK